MRRAAVWIAAALVTLFLSSASAAPQDKRVRGKVTAVSADSITVDVTGQSMTFTVNPATDVIARGAGTKAREAQQAGQKLVLLDVVKAGDNVEVSYSESGGTMVAKVIRGGVTAPPAKVANPPKRLQGVVSEVSGTSITVKPATGDAMTFMVDAKVRVTGVGLSTLTKTKQAEGGKVTLVDAVAVGDSVEVTYHAMETMNHAAAVRIMKKKT